MKEKDIAIRAVKKLQERGFEAYFAGGFVRDMLLGIDSKDIDIVTNAPYESISKLFDKVIEVGKKFNVCIVVEEGVQMEVASFRKEGEYKDNRRPEKVFEANAQEDAQRRDFTVNGLFFNPINEKLLDFVGGHEDIKKRVIKFIGDPEKRINEDHLRLLRAIRFKITLGFQYDKDTFEAVRKNAALIKGVSTERIRDEIIKIMASKNCAQGLIELSESQILKYIMPEIEQLKGVRQPESFHKEGDVFKHTYLALRALSPDAPAFLAIAVLLHDIGKPATFMPKEVTGDRIRFSGHAAKSAEIAQEILKRLKFPNFEIDTICWMIEKHMIVYLVDKMRPAKRRRMLTDPLFTDLMALVKADVLGRLPLDDEYLARVENLTQESQKARGEMKDKDKELVTGDDLIAGGLEPGPKFKEILEEIHDKQLTGELSSKEKALEYARSIK